MRRNVWLLTWIAPAIAVLLSVPAAADACTCVAGGPGTACIAAATADVVFEGTVEAFEPGGDQSPGAGIPGGTLIRVRFGGVRRLRGEPTAVVFTASSTESCGYDFKVGERYLVIADKDATGRTMVGLCSSTRPASQATGLLETVALLAERPGTGRVFGTLRGEIPGGGVGPVSGARITVEGPLDKVESQIERSTVTAVDGSFALGDLPFGNYFARAWPPATAPHLRPTGTLTNLTPAMACSEHNLVAPSR